jgi:outer membrane lipopolysaccharide assembly protein LptE/RlpB
MKISRYPCIYSLIILFTALMSGCGYHFPGDTLERSAMWKDTTLKIGGDGNKQLPVMAQVLKGKLADRLGISAKNMTASDEGKILHIDLSLPERILILEDANGRSDQYQITITAKPKLTGRDDVPEYPTVKGQTTYHELRASATAQSAKISAQNEALNNLADALVAVLSSKFQ